MTKLDEIEAQMKFSEEDGDVAAEWAWDYGSLLLRAVRQLGAKCNAHLFDEMVGVDPDVLELLETNDRMGATS